MRNYTTTFLTVVVLLTITSKVNSQIISPQEIVSLNNMKEQPAVSTLLQAKGFEFNETDYTIENEKQDLWVFKPVENNTSFTGGFFKKITDSSNKSRIILTLYNRGLYNDFINNLLKSNFRFKGMKTIEQENPVHNKADYNNYLQFAKKELSFMCREVASADKSRFYEIIFQ